jgi:hypothetical protein
VPVLSQINPVYTTPSYLSKIHFNIIHPYVLVFLVVSYGFPTNILYAFPFFPLVLHALPISSSLTWSF